jgi:hypothetical protein
MARTYERREVEELLRVLEQDAAEVARQVDGAASAVRRNQYTAYLEFRQKCEDFDTLSILTEYRLKNMQGGHQADLAGKFDALVVSTLSAALGASLHFLRVLSSQQSLPLGSHDVFTRELRHLHEAKERMSRPDLAAKLGPRARADIKIAEDILAVIVEKAPVLLELTPQAAA